MAVLGSLYRHGELTVGELAALERVQPPSMTRTVNCLEEGGHVARRPHETDGRQVVVALTEHRHARPCSPTARRRDAWLARRLADLTPHERAVLRAGRPDPRKARPRRTTDLSPTFRSLRNPNYRRYAAGGVVSNTGTWMQRVAQDWLVLQLTANSGAALGITTGLQFLPFLLLSPFAGAGRRPDPQAPAAPAHQPRDGGAGAASSACSPSPAPPRSGTSTCSPSCSASPPPSTPRPGSRSSPRWSTPTTSPTRSASTPPASTPPASSARRWPAC